MAKLSIARTGAGAGLIGAALILASAAAGIDADRASAQAAQATFANPIGPEKGQDPSVMFWNGHYYLVQSRRGVMRVFRSKTLTGIGRGEGERVWWNRKDGSRLEQLWAPEIVALDGKFYIYFAASTSGVHESRRMYVLEATDPLGPYTFKGKISDKSDHWAIDGSVIEQGGQRYFVWSGWKTAQRDRGQHLYIARMANPWTIVGPRHLLSSPVEPWERIGPEPINEGAQPLYLDGKTIIVFSASHSFTDDYCLATLTYKSGDPVSSKSWVKSNGCVFSKNVAGGVYGPGHNVLVPSPDGREIWNVYHAVATSGCGWDCRTLRMQKVNRRPDGTPDFGVPVPYGQPLPLPSGEAAIAAE